MCVSQCPTGTFASWTGTQFECNPCHAECDAQLGCRGATSVECNRCSHYRAANLSCVDACDSDERGVVIGGESVCVCNGYVDDSGTCHPCNEACGPSLTPDPRPACSGPLPSDCVMCADVQAANGSCVVSSGGGCPQFEVAVVPSAGSAIRCTCAADA